MSQVRVASHLLACASAGILLLGGCHADSASPPSRPEAPREDDAPEGSMLAPLDLVYVCGNKFLATNETRAVVQLTYRVVGTPETGSVALPEGAYEEPGYSETEIETSNRGVVELYRGEERVARRRNDGLPCGAPAISASAAAMGDPVAAGEWSSPFPWPVVAIHMSLLPDGRVLSWGASGTSQVWDPASGQFSSVATVSDEFCSGHTFLSDGRLLVAGGHISNGHGLPDVSLFDAGSQSWAASSPMRRGRWYPTITTLGSGDAVILAGRDQAGVVVTEPEVWSAGNLRVLTGASRTLPYYPRSFLAPDGRVFYAGEQQMSRYLNTSGAGSWTNVGNRRYGLRDYGAAVMYDRGKILYAGGGRTTNTAEIVDLTTGAPVWQWTGSMAFPRRHLNATVLPTGEVLVTGGSSGTAFNDIAASVHAAELWNPITGIWTTLSSNSVNRAYHATSVLLPDGRVLHAGSGEGSDAPDERNAELFSPPYLFKGPRPVVTTAPSAVDYGASFRVETPQAADIATVSLIRLGSATHAFDMNQRFQRLGFTSDDTGLTVTAPTSRNDAPPGHYMLFILGADSVPSVAAILKIGADAPPQPNVPPSADFSATCSKLSCTLTDLSNDPDGSVTAWSWTFGNGSGSAARSPSVTFAAGGSYQVGLTVTDDDGATGQRSQPIAVSTAVSLTLAGRTDATKQYVDLRWGGANGAMVDMYRDHKLFKTTPNDGKQTTVRTFVGAITYVYKMCETGSTICSNEASVTFK